MLISEKGSRGEYGRPSTREANKKGLFGVGCFSRQAFFSCISPENRRLRDFGQVTELSLKQLTRIAARPYSGRDTCSEITASHPP